MKVNTILTTNKVQKLCIEKELTAFQSPFLSPNDGDITSVFGQRKTENQSTAESEVVYHEQSITNATTYDSGEKSDGISLNNMHKLRKKNLIKICNMTYLSRTEAF